MAVEWKGAAELRAALLAKADPAILKRVVRMNAAELQERMQRQTSVSFKKGYSIGDTKKSIRTRMSDEGLTATVGPTTSYAPYVEYGTRFMDAEPFVAPAFHVQQEVFRRDIEKVTK